MPRTAYTLRAPAFRESSVVFASPHSGHAYSRDFLERSQLDRHSIRSSEDAFVDLLFEGVAELGSPLISAVAPRAFVDLNRSPEELDPALVEDAPKSAHNPRVSSGLGVVPRVVANGRSIYAGKIPLSEARARIEQYWRPYHGALGRLLEESRSLFGEAILIDCHSMPHEAIEGAVSGRQRRPDVVIGDRFGAAASPEIVDRVESALVAAGLVVARNTPFAGAYTAQHYGRPSRGQHAVQVELDRALYMDEATITPSQRFGEFRRVLMGAAAEIVAIGRRSMPLAAE
jgi:N-formylglutamate amidohydrolase